jgi:primosomal protein N' (replication factor Y)
MKCSHCNITLTYHSQDERLICHYCGHTERMPHTCPKCGSNYIRQFGTGTQKVEEEARKHFEGCSVLRMDMDTTSGKNSHEEILKQFRERNINILVGTQMIAKGHDFPNVTLVGVLAADSLLNIDDFRASERTFQLITQVAGRAGRGELPGRVIIQSYNTEDFSILAACKHDYQAFYRQEIKIREKLGYPPFTNIASLVVSAASDSTARSKAKEAAEILKRQLEEYREQDLVLGPMRAPLSRIRNRYRWRIIVKCKQLDILLSNLTQASDEFAGSRAHPGVMLGMDINTANML